jgi:hypothetical protein
MTAIYKYISKQEYVDNFLNEGEIFFQSLSYFTGCEEAQLRDKQEGALIFRPPDGLKLDLASGRQIGHSGALISRARNAHRLFIFRTSLSCSIHLARRFNTNYCIKICDVDEFSRRLQLKLKEPVQRLKNTKLLRGTVSYVPATAELGVDHALAEKIIFRKQDTFSTEKEYRFAFGLDANAFDAYNVDYSIGEFEAQQPKLVQPRILRIGPLNDICKAIPVLT